MKLRIKKKGSKGPLRTTDLFSRVTSTFTQLSPPLKHLSSLLQATPFFVHLFMICAVGLYAVLGAVVMQKLETKSVVDVKVDLEKRHLDLRAPVLDAGQCLEGERGGHSECVESS